MKWLIGDLDVVPSARTITRLRSAPSINKLIELMYLKFRQLLDHLALIDDSALYIDGTIGIDVLNQPDILQQLEAVNIELVKQV